MRKGLLGSIVVLAVNAGLAFGQMPRLTSADGYASMSDIVPAQAQMPPGGNGQSLTLPSQVLSNPMYGNDDSGPYIERIWIYGQYLLWAYKPGPNPVPLITSGPMSAPGTVTGGPLAGGVGVTTVFGGNDVDFGGVSGARMGIGAWLPNSDTIGWELSGLVLNQQVVTSSVSTNLAAGSLGTPAIGRPFIAFSPPGFVGTPASLVVSAPSTTPGLAGDRGFAIGTATSQLWTAEFNILANLYRDEFWTWNAYIGFRSVNLAEDIVVTERTITPAGAVGLPVFTYQGVAIPPGTSTTINLTDKFGTQNHFYGGNLGTTVEYRYRRIVIDVGNQVALGSMRSSINIIGTTSVTPAPAGTVSPTSGGLLAATTNLGRRIQNNFAVVEQPTIEVGYQITRGVRFSVGYDFLYTYNVARPGLQIDPGVNTNVVPLLQPAAPVGGPARPAPFFSLTDYYAQGVNFALTLRY